MKTERLDETTPPTLLDIPIHDLVLVDVETIPPRITLRGKPLPVSSLSLYISLDTVPTVTLEFPLSPQVAASTYTEVLKQELVGSGVRTLLFGDELPGVTNLCLIEKVEAYGRVRHYISVTVFYTTPAALRDNQLRQTNSK
jgi:hypothetical protein